MFSECCNGVLDCDETVATDETNCFCPMATFTCDCLLSISFPCGIDRGCISFDKQNDGLIDCPDGSDEPNVFITSQVYCNEQCPSVTFLRLDNVQSCVMFGPAVCDVSTCKTVSVPPSYCYQRAPACAHVICSSPCRNSSIDCNNFFQCADGRNITLANKFCDGVQD